MEAEADQPQIATTDTTGAETETLVGWQGNSVMRISLVSDSPILMHRGFEIGMAQSVSPLAPRARACAAGQSLEPRGETLTIYKLIVKRVFRFSYSLLAFMLCMQPAWMIEEHEPGFGQSCSLANTARECISSLLEPSSCRREY